MEDSTKDKIKGTIKFPCCSKEKMVVYEGSCGKISDKCPNCGKYALFDLDRMTSERAKPIKGASKIHVS